MLGADDFRPSMLDAALYYALDLGWPILPIKPHAKLPLTSHGVKDAIADEATVRDWWTQWPDANIGIATGEASGLLVLDVDPRHGGSESLASLATDPATTSTLTVNTGGGGQHLYYRFSGGASIGCPVGIEPGLDVRGTGGYIIAAPSVHESQNRYLVASGWPPDTDLITDAPDWLLERLESRRRGASATPSASNEGSTVPEGGRNAHLASVAGSMRRRGCSRASIEAALLNENEARCHPPLSETEVRSIAESISRYPVGPLIQRPFTDSGNGERLVDAYGDRIRYVPTWKKWLVFDGTRWKQDETEELRSMALAVTRAMSDEADQIDDPDKKQALWKHARRSESAAKQRAMIECAGPTVAITPAEFDRDPWLLNVRNGTIDLRTLELRKADPMDYLTKVADVSFDPEVECPTFLRFLDTIFAGDKDLISFIQMSMGYSLTGSTEEQCMFLCYGTGSNGKSTLLRTIEDLLGDYATATPVETLMQQRGGGISNDVARLMGVRFTTVMEIQEGRQVAESLLKALTGGDSVSARFLYSETFTFIPRVKLWFGTNHKPRVRGNDHGFWRRVRLIPFEVQIPESEQDPSLPRKLAQEKSGILNWLLDGLRMWQEVGRIHQPEAVLNATKEYRSDIDIIGQFVSDAVVEREGSTTTNTDMYEAYRRWAEDAGERVQSQRWLTTRLEEHGLIRGRSSKSRYWTGVSVRSDAIGGR